ncbi:alginate export family protein [Urbifossiella limnaea]|uniref:Alginate export domain-containing protein n=1 Tax=Urbifossiella limnaea TaxID=2528023 RepID=A0A517Y0A4_9BACT|nr:alginate export family protein [Urbifossiella limnaea]QDU23183.1 hypothetical protein ETAA1_51750 [Urbifossiella limnaea]
MRHVLPRLRAAVAGVALAAGPAAAQPPAELPPVVTLPEVPQVCEEEAAPKGAPPAAGTATLAAPAPAPAPAGPKWVTPAPRSGSFIVPPVGCGYYSALDQLRGETRQAPPKYPYPRFGLMQQPNFDINWSYLKNPQNAEHDYADPLKWMHVCDGVTLTLGGDVRYRLMQEVNSNNRLAGQVDNYDLYRNRTYADLWVDDWLRVYGEFLYADYTRRSFTPLATDADRGDILNLFVDARVAQFGEKDNPVYVRAGRQELIYGSQRLVSPLEWVNTRRTFQGVKAFTRTDKWDFDLFVVQPVVPNAGRFDSVDNNQVFSGAFFTYRPAAGINLDLYYLNLDNTNPTARGQYGAVGGQNVNTMGTRLVGAKNNWLWDAEGAFQFGSYANQAIIARSASVSGGYHFKDALWEPQVWVGYDYASGDPDPQASGTRRTFNQLFPFGHYYFGFTDVVGRQNINDVFAQAVLYPEKWLTCIAQFHVLRLDSDRDALYAANGTVLRQDRTGRAGNDVGNAIDLRVNAHLTHHSDVLVGYSRLFAGDFIRNTAGTGAAGAARSADPELFYLQYSYKW